MTIQTLRIHANLPLVRETLGPGNRAVVWAQGCTHQCRACMVTEAWDVNGGVVVEVQPLAKELLANPEIEGITVSGGEPFQQVIAVSQLLEAFRAAGKNSWVYTGYTIEELVERNDPAIDRMLSLIDVLVDGRYDEKQAGNFRLRGSGNQRIIRLTEAIPLERINTGEASRVEVTLDDGQLVVVGIPPPGFLCQLRERLEQRGIVVTRDFVTAET